MYDILQFTYACLAAQLWVDNDRAQPPKNNTTKEKHSDVTNEIVRTRNVMTEMWAYSLEAIKQEWEIKK